jgi:chromosome segregation ATPase
MTPGFNANVAARKPRTQIGRVISELTTRPPEEEEAPQAPAEAPPADREREAATEPPATHAAPADVVALPAAHAPANTEAMTPRVPGGRDQVDRLRERLAAAARAPLGAAEPRQTAAAIRDLVDGLRARLESSARERAELARALEEVRASLARTEADLQKERRTRQAVEAQAEERQRIADDAVAEAEALAAERDQVLGDVAEHRRLESEQAELLAEAEALLGRRDAERGASARELAEVRQLLDLRIAEVADLEARLETEAADRRRHEARCQQLGDEVARLSKASEALESIEALTRG